MLDQGRIRDPRGDALDARQHVIVLTTNALTPETLCRQPMGFTSDKLQPVPFDLLTTEFPAELLGRLDDIVIFNPLGPREIRRIIELRLKEMRDRLFTRGVLIELDEARLIDRIQDIAEAAGTGARAVAAAIDRLFLQPVARVLLEAYPHQPTRLRIDKDDFIVECLEDLHDIGNKASALV